MEGERIVCGYCDLVRQEELREVREFNGLNEKKLNNAKDIIMYTKKKFEASLLKHKGPSVIPTIMKHHPDRYIFVEESESTFGRRRNQRNPPPVLPFSYSFTNDIASNILFNFNEKKSAAYLKHVKPAKIIQLKKEVCAEQALEEMISNQSIFYSEDSNILGLSNYVDPDVENWSHPVCHCYNCQFLVDFSILLPEKRVSTVFVICHICGQYVETVMLDSTMKAAIKDICHNIAQLDLTSKGDSSKVVVNKESFQNMAQLDLTSKGDSSKVVVNNESFQNMAQLDLTSKGDSSKVVVNKESFQNMAQLNLTSTEGDFSNVSVIRLSTHGCLIDGFDFVEGLMAVIPLFGIPQAPSVFVRTRLTYYLDERQNIYSVIHQ